MNTRVQTRHILGLVPGRDHLLPARYLRKSPSHFFSDCITGIIVLKKKLHITLWVGKCLEKQGKTAEAQNYYAQASAADPTGYYGIRGAQLKKDNRLFHEATQYRSFRGPRS